MILIVTACLIAACAIFTIGYVFGAILAANRDDRW